MSRSSILLGCRRANSSIALGISRAKSRWTARKLSSDKRAPDIDERNVVFVRFSPLNDLSAEHVVTGRKLIVHNWLVCRGVLEHEKHHARYASALCVLSPRCRYLPGSISSAQSWKPSKPVAISVFVSYVDNVSVYKSPL